MVDNDVATLPNLADYTHHRTDTDATFEGTPVPGLRADFYRQPSGDRTASVGRYTVGGRDVLLAWGYVDEQHCRHHTVRDPEHGWQQPTAGCPTVRIHREPARELRDTPVVRLEIQAPDGAWITVTTG